MKIFQDIQTRKLLVAIVSALFGVLMIPHGAGAQMSVYVFPSVAAGIAFGITIMQLLEFSKIWKNAGKDNVNG
jgi:hypothetical protein